MRSGLTGKRGLNLGPDFNGDRHGVPFKVTVSLDYLPQPPGVNRTTYLLYIRRSDASPEADLFVFIRVHSWPIMPDQFRDFEKFLPCPFNTLQLPSRRIPIFASYADARKTIFMSTEAQIAANRRNAEASTGPRTAEGKARVSRNSTTFGLYSAGDVVRPEEESLYQAFCEDFQQQLAPQGAMETTLAAEIVHAAWRLRRCAAAESSLEAPTGLDPMLDPATAAAWNSIDRARTQALRHFQRASSRTAPPPDRTPGPKRRRPQTEL